MKSKSTQFRRKRPPDGYSIDNTASFSPTVTVIWFLTTVTILSNMLLVLNKKKKSNATMHTKPKYKLPNVLKY